MAKIRQIESALRFLTVDIEPRKGGLWLFLARLSRRISPRIWTWAERYLLSLYQVHFLQLLRSIGGLHFAPIDLASLAVIHRLRERSDSKFCFVVEGGVNQLLMAALINNLFEPCVLVESNLIRQNEREVWREFRRLLGIRLVRLDPSKDNTAQITQCIASGQSVIFSELELELLSAAGRIRGPSLQLLKLSWAPTNNEKKIVHFKRLSV